MRVVLYYPYNPNGIILPKKSRNGWLIMAAVSNVLSFRRRNLIWRKKNILQTLGEQILNPHARTHVLEEIQEHIDEQMQDYIDTGIVSGRSRKRTLSGRWETRLQPARN